MTRSRVVVFELYLGGHWRWMGGLAEMETCGSVSSHEPGGRQVILFGWLDGTPGVWRSVAGVDIANDAIREVCAMGMEQLANLTGGPYEREVFTLAGPVSARWSLDVDPEDEA